MKLPLASRILVKGKWWDLGRPVREAHLIGGRVLVFYEEASWPEEASNLVAFDLKEKLLWVAGNPTGNPTDRYSRVLSESPLKVANTSGLSALLDIETGRVKRIIFKE